MCSESFRHFQKIKSPHQHGRRNLHLKIRKLAAPATPDASSESQLRIGSPIKFNLSVTGPHQPTLRIKRLHVLASIARILSRRVHRLSVDRSESGGIGPLANEKENRTCRDSATQELGIAGSVAGDDHSLTESQRLLYHGSQIRKLLQRPNDLVGSGQSVPLGGFSADALYLLSEFCLHGGIIGQILQNPDYGGTCGVLTCDEDPVRLYAESRRSVRVAKVEHCQGEDILSPYLIYHNLLAKFRYATRLGGRFPLSPHHMIKA